MSNCNTCITDSCQPRKGLIRLGIHDYKRWDYVIALAGNPNTGKSTVFNALTGLRQHTGNWPGKTVTRAEGGFQKDGKKYKLIDLPGTYSLLSNSQDEEIARNFILFGQPDCTVIVVDATALERNLNLVLQVLEITKKAVVCLNLMDEAKRKGVEIDHRSLAKYLGVPVVPTIAIYTDGLDRLISVIEGVVKGEFQTSPYRIRISGVLENAIDKLAQMIERAFPGLPNTRWLAIRLLDSDGQIKKALTSGELLEYIPKMNVATKVNQTLPLISVAEIAR